MSSGGQTKNTKAIINRNDDTIGPKTW
jgi:hypothetical protein